MKKLLFFIKTYTTQKPPKIHYQLCGCEKKEVHLVFLYEPNKILQIQRSVHRTLASGKSSPGSCE